MYAIIQHMKRTTIFIDEALEGDLRAIAERERRPVSGLVREALESYVALRKRKGPKLGFIAIGGSGRHETAEVHEELLWRDPDGESSGTGLIPTRTRGRPGASPRNAPRKKRA